MATSAPVVAAETLTRIGQILLSCRQAYHTLGAVLIGNPPTQAQLDDWQEQLAECAAAWSSALEVVTGLLRDVRQIIDRSPVDYGGRW